MVLKIKDDQYTSYAKELENKRDGIQIDFNMNEFGNSPLSSMSQVAQSADKEDSPSPFAGFAQKEEKPKLEFRDHHNLKFFADL
jgi:hypothetical protein